MPRVSEVALQSLPGEIGWTLASRGYAKLGQPTWELVTAHCPHVLKHIVDLMDAFAAEGTMPKRYIEIAVVTVSRLNACRHCVGRHSVRLAGLGLSHETIEKILDPEPPAFDAVDRLVRDYAVAVSEDSARMRDAIFASLQAHFDEAQIVELTWRIALAGAFNRFNNAMQVDLDDGHLAALLSQSGREESLPAAPGAIESE